MRSSIVSLFLFFCFNSFSQKNTTSTFLTAECKTVQIGDRLTISYPADLEMADMSEQLSDEVKKKINKMNTYTLSGKYKMDDDFSIFISAVSYVPSITASLEGSLQGAQNN